MESTGTISVVCAGLELGPFEHLMEEMRNSTVSVPERYIFTYFVPNRPAISAKISSGILLNSESKRFNHRHGFFGTVSFAATSCF